MIPGLILRFVLAGLIGAGGAVGIGALTSNRSRRRSPGRRPTSS